MTKLSLGPIANTEPVRLTVLVPTSLKADLDRYAELRAAAWGAQRMDAATLIPHILTTFLGLDRAFRRARRRPEGNGTSSA